MKLTLIEMPVSTMLAEIRCKEAKRADVAMSYALALMTNLGHEWCVPVNAAIIERWSMSGLQWIKNRAWKLAQERLAAKDSHP